MTGWVVRVPASSANLGAGFDVLGMALTLHTEVGCGTPPSDARQTDQHHPADIAFRRLGGTGPLWTRSAIPIGRGLGFSGAVRVGGAAAALVQRDGTEALHRDESLTELLAVSTELERHADNAAASLFGGLVVAAADTVARVPLAFDPAVVVWVPNVATTSTDHSRATLPSQVSREDAVFNLGRVAMFVAACANGDAAMLRAATQDRLHQDLRLAQVPQSATAMSVALEAGAWASWLSGSGPTVAMFCESSRASEIAELLPTDGHTKVLRIDHEGAVVTAIPAAESASDGPDTQRPAR